MPYHHRCFDRLVVSLPWLFSSSTTPIPNNSYSSWLGHCPPRSSCSKNFERRRLEEEAASALMSRLLWLDVLEADGFRSGAVLSIHRWSQCYVCWALGLRGRATSTTQAHYPLQLECFLHLKELFPETWATRRTKRKKNNCIILIHVWCFVFI